MGRVLALALLLLVFPVLFVWLFRSGRRLYHSRTEFEGFERFYRAWVGASQVFSAVVGFLLLVNGVVQVLT